MNRNERALAIEKQKADLHKGKSELSDKANKLEKTLKLSRMMSDDRDKRDMEIELKGMRRSIDKMLDEERILTYAEIKLGKLYLAEIIEDEKPDFGSNNLILAPVGSGKTTFIESLLKDVKEGTVLHLVSNDTLKESVSPLDDRYRKERANNTFTTQNNKVYGDKEYRVHVMSYAEFGSRINQDNEFVDKVEKIYCDEIHSLPEYRDYTNDINLSHAIKYLFQKHESKQIFYFTATDYNLRELERKNKGQLKNVKTFDYTKHDKILQYVDRSTYKINHIKQLEPHLRSRLWSFNYYGYKGLAYAKTIEQEKIIEQMLIKEGFTPLVLWSTNNEDYPLSDSQLISREFLINEGKIPEPYNFLVINSALREGWNLKDKMLQLVIINTTNETDKIQARGRIRHDVDVLVYRTDCLKTPSVSLVIPEEFMNVPLVKKQKDTLVKTLNVINPKGAVAKWPTIKKKAMEAGYDIIGGFKVIDGKKTRVDTITVEV